MAIDGPKGPDDPDEPDKPERRPTRPDALPGPSALELERARPFGSRAAHRAELAALPRRSGGPLSDTPPRADPPRGTADTEGDRPHGLPAAQSEEPARDARKGRDRPAETTAELGAKLRESVTDDSGRIIGIEGRRDGVRMVPAEQLRDLVEKIRAQLGDPDQVVETPKGTFEVWLISTRPRSAVTYRMFSKSGGMTVDFSNVPGMEDIKKVHILQAGDRK